MPADPKTPSFTGSVPPAEDSSAPALSPLQTALESFLLDGAARRLTPGTLAFYREKLAPFLAMVAALGVNTPAEITADHVRAHLVQLQQRGLKPNTQHGTARALRAWCNFLIREGDLVDSPMRRVRMPRLEIQPLPAFSSENVQKLLAVCLAGRDRCLLMALLDTGCRAGEFVALNVEDVDMGTGAVQVRRGKGGKPRTVYLGAKTRRLLLRYLRGRPPTGPLWVSLNTGQRLTIEGLRMLLRRLGKRAGVAHCHPHTFRRTFALWSLRAGMNIYVLQRLMGHEDLTVLRRYLALVEADLQAAHARYGPVDAFL